MLLCGDVIPLDAQTSSQISRVAPGKICLRHTCVRPTLNHLRCEPARLRRESILLGPEVEERAFTGKRQRGAYVVGIAELGDAARAKGREIRAASRRADIRAGRGRQRCVIVSQVGEPASVEARDERMTPALALDDRRASTHGVLTHRFGRGQSGAGRAHRISEERAVGIGRLARRTPFPSRSL